MQIKAYIYIYILHIYTYIHIYITYIYRHTYDKILNVLVLKKNTKTPNRTFFPVFFSWRSITVWRNIKSCWAKDFRTSDSLECIPSQHIKMQTANQRWPFGMTVCLVFIKTTGNRQLSSIWYCYHANRDIFISKQPSSHSDARDLINWCLVLSFDNILGLIFPYLIILVNSLS